jgi:hypothetical protein
MRHIHGAPHTTKGEITMSDKEQRVWTYILHNRWATVEMIADACGVEAEFVGTLLNKIGTPDHIWRGGRLNLSEPSSALAGQVGGDHYREMAVQPWEAMEAWLTPEEYRGYHKAVAIAYLARERQKGGDEDIKKAIHHLQRLVETWGKK